MTDEEFGFWLVVWMFVVCLVVARILTHVYRIEWFRERLLANDRWTRTRGMLPIAVPMYLLAGLIWQAWQS